MASGLPTGTVTFFFSDIEESTSLAQRLGESFSMVLADHFHILRSAVEGNRGFEVKTIGDGYFAVFSSAADAVEAATAIQRELGRHPWPEGGAVRVRIGLHTGEAKESGGDYIGLEVHRASRISDAGHGGQVVVSVATHALTSGAYEYRDLGEHALKGLERRESLFQLLTPGLPFEFPPLRTATAHPNNLPVLTASIVGRSSEMEQLSRLLSDNRLVTILGPGGVGKTRLALALATDSLPLFPGGVFFVELSAVSDSVFVVAAIAEATGAKEGTVGAVVETIGHADVLLVLDNFEQVVAAAVDVEQLLRRVGGLRVVVTSQIPLRVAGEQRLVLAPLQVSGVSEESPAMRLFLDRARSVNPGFKAEPEELRRLVDLLDGLPLALELAAARANLLGAAEMIERFESGQGLAVARSGVARHRSLQDALSWSFELLEADDQAAFRRLGVFASGMTIAAAEAVAAGQPVGDPLEAVAELVDRSLLLEDRAAPGRWRMLDGVRRFALERLEESRELDRVGERYVAFYCELGRQATRGLQSDRGEWWRARLTAEMDNLRDVLSRLWDKADADGGLALLGDTWRFYQSGGHLVELELWLDRFFGLVEGGGLSDGVVRGLMARGALRYWQSDPTGAIDDYQLAVEGARAGDDEALLADALYGLATSLIIAHQETEGVSLLEEVRDLYDRLGDAGGVADVVTAEVFGVISRSGPAGLGPQLEDAVRLYEAAGRKIQATQGIYGLAGVAIAEGRFEDGLDLARRGLRQSEFLNDAYLKVWGLEFASLAELELGNLETAALLAGATSAGQSMVGGGWSPKVLGLADAQTRLVEILGEGAAEAAMAPGRELPLYRAVALATVEEAEA